MFDAAIDDTAAAGLGYKDYLPRALPWLCVGKEIPSLAGSLLLVAQGLVTSVSVNRTSRAARELLDVEPWSTSVSTTDDVSCRLICSSLSTGEWLDASWSPSTLEQNEEGRNLSETTALDTTAVVGVTLPNLVSECCTSALAAAGKLSPSENVPPAPEMNSSAVLLRLSSSHLAAFVATLPAGPKRMQLWHSSQGQVGGHGAGAVRTHNDVATANAGDIAQAATAAVAV